MVRHSFNTGKHLVRLAGVAAFVVASSSTGFGQSWDHNSNVRDDVTGYLCVDPGCTTLRLPNSKCLCQKQNPWVRNVRELRLKCSVVSFGNPPRQCPVKPKYGIAE